MALDDRDYMRSDGGNDRITRAMYSPKMYRRGVDEPFSRGEERATLWSWRRVLMFGVFTGVVSFAYRNYDGLHLATPGGLPLPSSGVLMQAFPVGRLPGSAPLSIEADQSKPGTSYVVRVRDWQTATPVLALFVASGHAVEVNLPLGIYRISILEGRTWYGAERMFGDATIVSEARDPVRLYQSNPQETTGAAIRLGAGPAGYFTLIRAPGR